MMNPSTPDATTIVAPPGELWPDTHDSWLDGLLEPARRAAVLEAMSAAYRRPLLRSVQSALPELSLTEAEDIVQQFFTDEVFPRGSAGTTLFDRHDPDKGRLRSLLRTALRNFISSWLRARRTLKRGAGHTRVDMAEVDADTDYLPHGLDPYFDREWALDVFSRAFQRLETTYLSDPERARRYEALKPWLVGYQEDARLTALAATLGLEPATLRKFLERLREDWQKALRAVIAPTVASPEQLEQELRYLCEVLRG